MSIGAPFTDEQRAELDQPLNRKNVKKNPRGFSYVESWHCEAEANRIFGFDGWTSTVLEHKCVCERDVKMGRGTPRERDGYSVSYICTMRVVAGGCTRDGVGAGHGIDADLGLAHESALKEAASDAEKRALKTFGNVFGLALYDKTQENVEDAPPAREPPRARAPAAEPPPKPPEREHQRQKAKASRTAPVGARQRPLAARTDLFLKALAQAKSQLQLRTTYEAGVVLRQDLDQADPEALVGINTIYEELYDTLPPLADGDPRD